MESKELFEWLAPLQISGFTIDNFSWWMSGIEVTFNGVRRNRIGGKNISNLSYYNVQL